MYKNHKEKHLIIRSFKKSKFQNLILINDFFKKSTDLNHDLNQLDLNQPTLLVNDQNAIMSRINYVFNDECVNYF